MIFFIKICNDESDKEYLFEAEVQYPKNLSNLLNDAPSLPERMKIEEV